MDKRPRRRPRRPLAIAAGAGASPPGVGRKASVRLTLRSAVEASARSLVQRVRLGEGGLIGMATWVAAWRSRDPVEVAVVFALATLLLTSLYLYNDVADRVIDAHNPKKRQLHRQLLAAHPRVFGSIAIGLHLVVCLLAWGGLGPAAAGAAASLLLLNPLYSGVLKRVPGLDVVAVGIMGGAVVAMATTDVDLVAMAAAMTGLSHAFQTRVDADADRAAGFRSSAGADAAWRWLIWIGLGVWYAVTAAALLGAWGAVSAIIPLALLASMEVPTRAWAWARGYFAVIWLLAAT